VHTEYASQADVAVVGIAMDTPSSLEAVKLFVKRHGITFPSAIDDGRIREITGVHMVPTTLILDQKGVVQARIPGARHDLKERISREIDRLRR
jgi:peroxiredoxin